VPPASSYSFTTISADNGSAFDVVASTAQGGLSITAPWPHSPSKTAVFEQGSSLLKHWLNKGADLTIPESGAFGPPDFQMASPGIRVRTHNENGGTYVKSVEWFCSAGNEWSV
jgi:hypothetical protein